MINTTYTEHELVDFINQLIKEALVKRISDIHFEPYQDKYRIRARIDGVLQEVATLPIELSRQVAVRLKVMAKLDIAEQRLPQDGQLNLDEQTMRISTLPVAYGEKVVLRVMDNSTQQLFIDQLGLTDDELVCYKAMLNSSQGLILVTGPTGSGKTVTLYSGLMEINRGEQNICSAEDPIELPIAGINQTQVNAKIDLSFSKILRSLLRQDPDTIMIGEIRDKETAEIAVQASQTGHLVLSTLHTNSSAEALIRLNQMGIQNYLIASSLKLIIAQRLVRKLCPHCKKLSAEPIQLPKESFSDEDGNNTISHHYLAQGCQHCIGGYKGRIGVYELLVITPEIQSLLLNQSAFTLSAIQQFIAEKKIKTLAIAGIEQVKNGVTSFAEIQRVLDYA